MNILEIKDNKNGIVKKHQQLIRNARYSLSELGIKVVSCLIAMVRIDDTDFQEYNLKVQDFKDLVCSNSNDIYRQIDTLTNELMSKPFKIGDEKFNWCYYARYHKNDAFVTLKIAPELKPYLLELKNGNFTQYHLENILKLKSSYVIRFYELLIDRFKEYRRYKKSNLVFEIKIDYLRETFNIPDSYRYNDIKRNIIEKSKKQFKQKTDITFDYIEQKIGRRVDRLIITVKENNKGSNDYLSSLQKFIAYIRKNYINKDLLIAQDIETKEIYTLSVSKNGILYDKNGKDFTPQRAKQMWRKLFDLAKLNKLHILND